MDRLHFEQRCLEPFSRNQVTPQVLRTLFTTVLSLASPLLALLRGNKHLIGMPNLDTLLSFPSHRAGPSTAAERTPIPPSSSHVLVTDTTDAPALFVLIHFLRAAHAINRRDRSTPPPTSLDSKGKARAYTKVIWLGCNSDGIVHLKNVARKSGIHLEDDARTGAFCHIDAIAHACPPSAHDSLAASAAALNIHQQHQPGARAFLHRLYAKLAQQLTEPSAQTEPDPSNVDDWSSRNIIIIDDLTALAWTLDPSDPLGQAIELGRELNNWISAITSLAAKVSWFASKSTH